MPVRLGLAVLALALAAAGGPDVSWQGYDNALKVSAVTGRAVCIVFQNDKVDPNGSS